MNPINIACIVEGYGETDAVPILVRRIVQEIDASLSLMIPHPPIRVPRGKLVKRPELERAVELAASKNRDRGGILILMDADDDCPASLGPELLTRAQQARSDIPIAVVLAKHEYEAWFVAAAASLRGQLGLPETLLAPAHPESIRSAKDWLQSQLPSGRRYSPTVDQSVLTRKFDMNAARQCASFDKLWRDITRLVEEILKHSHGPE